MDDALITVAVFPLGSMNVTIVADRPLTSSEWRRLGRIVELTACFHEDADRVARRSANALRGDGEEGSDGDK